MAFGDVDGVFARADRVVRATHRRAPPRSPCRWSAAGSIADWDADAEQLTIHASTQSPHMLPDAAARPDRRARWSSIRVLAGDVGGGFGLKNGVAREDVAVVAAAIDLGRPVKWIEDRLEHLATGGQAREEMADVEAAVTDDGVLLGRPDGRSRSTSAPTRAIRSPARCYGDARSRGSFQGPTKIEAISAHHTAGRSATRRPTSPTAGRGRPATSCASACSTSSPASWGSTRSRSAAATTCVRDEPPLAMLTGQPFVGVTTQRVRRAGGAGSSTGTASGDRQAQRAAEGRYLGARHGVVPRGGARTQGARASRRGGILGDEVDAPVGRRTTGSSDRHPPAAARPGPRDDARPGRGRRARRPVRGRASCVYGDTDITPVALVGTGGSRAATMANGAVLHAVAAAEGARCWRSPPTCSRPTPPTSRSAERRDQRPRHAGRRALAGRAGADRRARSRTGSRTARTDELTVTRSLRRRRGRLVGRHALLRSSRSTSRPGIVEIERYVVVEDCGVAVNPAIVEGQIRGGVAQGIGAVLLEHAAYDEDGQFLAGHVHGLPDADDDGRARTRDPPRRDRARPTPTSTSGASARAG